MEIKRKELKFIEEDTFKTIVPLDEIYSLSVSDDKRVTIKSDDIK